MVGIVRSGSKDLSFYLHIIMATLIYTSGSGTTELIYVSTWFSRHCEKWFYSKSKGVYVLKRKYFKTLIGRKASRPPASCVQNNK